MLAKTYSFGIQGLEAYPVTIEVFVSGGLPSTIIVGLPDNAIRESKERVRSAIKNCGYKFEPRRITVNLSPADTKKEGPSFDLAMALGILAATKQINADSLEQFAVLGELSLDGSIHPIRGALAIALAMAHHKTEQPALSSFRGLILPSLNAPEAAIVPDVPLYPVKNLEEVIYLLNNPGLVEPFKADPLKYANALSSYDIDFCDVKGQAYAKRGLEIAAAGGHNVLMLGPPGSGKSMLAKRLVTILPDMTWEETLETTKIHSVMGLLKNDQALVKTRPFRSPHHTSSDIALVGGGSLPKAGEVTLSHNGLLFLDELPEFNRNVLEALRQPLEDRFVTVARASKTLKFPAKFMLVAAMNPCPCGWMTDKRQRCQCTSFQIQKYMSKISGPLLDRIDLHLEVPALPSIELLSSHSQENSLAIKERTTQARLRQHERFARSPIRANAEMNHRQVKEFCPLTSECKSLLKQAIEELNLSARAYDKVLKVARTIADLAKAENIFPEHLAEAIQYRSLDRGLWK